MPLKPTKQVAIVCRNNLMIRKCLQGLEKAAIKYRLEYNFLTDIRISIVDIVFTIMNCEEADQKLRGIDWKLIYADSNAIISCGGKLTWNDICYHYNSIGYLDFGLYDSEIIMENVVKTLLTIPKPYNWNHTKEPQESGYRRITLGDDE